MNARATAAPVRVRRHPRTQRSRAEQRGGPPVARLRLPTGGPLRCERCDATYERKTWRARGRATTAALADTVWTLCPACSQAAAGEYFGRVIVAAGLPEALEMAVRRRVWNVERRARHTQPERRLVGIERTRRGLEILTTSQKLAHRIARELAKAFGGRARYEWTDRHGQLDATWTPADATRVVRTEHARPSCRDGQTCSSRRARSA
jgi:NMD3 family protein